MEWLLYALKIGVPEERFWTMNPRMLRPYIEAYKDKMKEKQYESDILAWQIGNYVQYSVSVSLDRAFNGKKAKSEYVKQPFSLNQIENEQLSAEEIERREIQKEIDKMELWVAQAKISGLPQTSIK